MSAPETLPRLFLDAVERYGTKRAALRYKAGGKWHDISHQEMARRVKLVALGLRKLGLERGASAALLSTNRPEWAIADFASQMSRVINVPVYPSLPARQVAYILKDSASQLIFVEDREQYDKIREVRSELPGLERVVIFEGQPDEGTTDMTWRALMQQGASAEDEFRDYDEYSLSANAGDVATIIYTSGTTGEPKGVLLTHDNFCSNVVACCKVLPVGPDDTSLSFLPLSHSFERTAGQYVMLHRGVTINYAETMDTIAQDMVDVKPTVVTGVPRVYEKIYARVLEKAVSGSSLKRGMFFWAKKNAEEWAELTLNGETIPSLLAIKKKMADSLVFSKLRARTGGRIRYFVSGAAPLPAEIAKFFYAAGLPIVEGYGLTETSPVIAVNPIDGIRLGTVGRPIPGVEVRIADDGEIIVRGPNVMKGYHNKPEATDKVLDSQGWFSTGDIGELDEDGYLKITDRKKDVIKTAGGKMIAPQPIENKVKLSQFISNAVVLGDKRRFPIVLVVPEWETVEKWARERKMSDITSRQDLVGNSDVAAKIEREVMLPLRDLASYETPKKVLIIEDDFTIEGGELTPTMKVKRPVIEKKYADRIEEAYAE